MAELLHSADLPRDFVYPRLFLRVVAQDLLDLDPWWILQGEELRRRLMGIRDRYPERELVPFARRGDRDDVACFDIDRGDGQVSVIGDFEQSGFEDGEHYGDFGDWLRAAVDDMIAFED